MHIHILGICGTFMGSLALLAKAKGHHVTGADEQVYPPMSTQLQSQGITIHENYDPEQLDLYQADLIVIGNAMRRGYEIVEAVLAKNLPYTSGPAWLAEHVLQDRWVLACAGTHGKTTTSSMLAWILEDANLKPGFLIGGVPQNFPVSAQLGESPFFVIEADEYDTAFFDKRSKFLHYRPKTAIINNLEFDHADIFSDLKAIQWQFHQLVRTIPNTGLIITPAHVPAINEVIQQGCWTPCETIMGDDANWQANSLHEDGSHFSVSYQGKVCGEVEWEMLGQHNIHNALAAVAASHHAGVAVETALQALCRFKGVKRRMELRAQVGDIFIYDDFAHHPTAIETTLAGLRKRVNDAPISAVLQLGSYTMREGVHADTLAPALAQADKVFLLRPDGDFHIDNVLAQFQQKVFVADSVLDLIPLISENAAHNEHILVMSNKGFDGIHDKLAQHLTAQ